MAPAGNMEEVFRDREPCLRRVLVCSGEYMSERGICHLCDSTCLQCSGPEREECTQCPPTRVFDDGRCSIRCPKGRYTLDKECFPCHHTCQECTDAGPDNCTSCGTDVHGVERYLFEGQCRQSCPEGRFHSAWSRCEPCPDDCLTCSSALHCVRCGPGFRFRAGLCVPLQCSDGEVADSRGEACVPCDEGCKQCKHKTGDKQPDTVCVKCEDDFYQFGSDCHKSCPERSYSVEKTHECVQCEDEHCENCDDAQCYWCEKGFYVSDGVCVDHCGPGFFVDAESQDCEPCHRACRTCGGPRYDDCDSCEDGFTLTRGRCLEARQLEPCKDKFYRSSQGLCRPCHSSCQSCSGSTRKDCLSCHPGQFVTAEQTCVSHCSPGTFPNTTSGRCDECSRGCMACQDAQLCLHCRHGLVLEEGACSERCIRGFPRDGACQPCLSECLSCQGNASTCLSCQPHYFLVEQSCRADCPEGFFPSETECQPCPVDCVDCNQDGLCKKCAQYYFLHEALCVDDCPDGFFVSEQQQECGRCHRNCSSCDGPDSDDCIACKDHKAVRFRGRCLSQCPSNTYYDRTTNECRECDKSCLSCTDHLPSSCLSCAERRLLDASGHCVWYSECSINTYMDPSGQCQKCHGTCHRCFGPRQDQCFSCNPPHFLLNSTCVLKCPAGFYAEDREERVCERCHWSCERCSGRHSLECDSCRPGYFRQGGGCVQTCSPSHFGNSESMSCERCDPSCDACRGPGNTHCISCREHFLYLPRRGQCVQKCPEGYYQERNSKNCRRCHPSCKTCTKEGALSCSTCYEGYHLFGSICNSNCMVGFHQTAGSSDEPECAPCDPSCVDCRGPSQWTCTVCPALMVLAEDGRCLSCCGNESVRRDGSFPWECCDCRATTDECVLGVNSKLRRIVETEPSAAPQAFAIVCVLLIVSVGLLTFYYLQARHRPAGPHAKAGGYEKLDCNGTSHPAHGLAPTVFDEQSRRIIECDRDDEDEEDEDIVYMSQDGTLYRKFKYGLLDEEEEEMEYDDESYSFS